MQGVATTTNNNTVLAGSISDVWFRNIQMQSENGVLISGRTHRVGPIYFDHCSLQLSVLGNCSCSKGDESVTPFHTGCRDYRPLETAGQAEGDQAARPFDRGADLR